MKRVIFLIIFLGIFCFPSIFYAQINAIDRFKMQQQGDQFKMKSDQFKNQIQEKAQRTTRQAQEAVQESQGQAAEYQENEYQTTNQAQEVVQGSKEKAAEYQSREEEGTEFFDKYAQQEQKPNFATITKLYAIPVLIMAVVCLVFLFVWHQRL